MPGTSGSTPRRARSSPTPTTMLIPTRTGCGISPPPSSGPRHVGIGGPNIPPPGDGPVAEAVANAPGGPIHVLLSDQEAEHIPGCNMAFRRSALLEIEGFDPQFRTAGDDVDICWRLRERGWTLGFHPGAVVWHHRRNSVRMYWKQQKGYGRAEALLERKWPEKYNQAGHVNWAGSLYGLGLTRTILSRPARVYQGSWGSALFQSLYQPAARPPGRPSPDAGMVSRDPAPRRALGAGPRVVPVAGGPAALGPHGGRGRRASGAERGARAVPPPGTVSAHDPEALRSHHAAARPAADRAPARPSRARTVALAPARALLGYLAAAPPRLGLLARARARQPASIWRTSARRSGRRGRSSRPAATSTGGTWR